MPKDGNRQKFASLDGKAGVPDNAQDGALVDGQTPPAGGDDDGGDDDDADDGGSNPPADGGGKNDAAKYTDADVDALLKKKLAQKRAQMEREIREQIAKEDDDQRTEAEKLANMTELQRAQYEAKKILAENEELKAERDLSQQMAIARKELADANIAMPDELLSMFVSPEAEKTSAAIERLKVLMPEYVNEAVRRELKRNPPTDPNNGGGSGKSFGASFAEAYSKKKNGGNQ